VPDTLRPSLILKITKTEYDGYKMINLKAVERGMMK